MMGTPSDKMPTMSDKGSLSVTTPKPVEVACPYCGQSFANEGLLDAHLKQGCPGHNHELSPTGKGWHQEIAVWADPTYWTNPDHPAKQPGVNLADYPYTPPK